MNIIIQLAPMQAANSIGKKFGLFCKTIPPVPGTIAHPSEPPTINNDASLFVTVVKLSAYKNPLA